MFYNILAVFIGGGLGATARYLSTEFAKKNWGLPIVGTYFVNMLGCLLIGYIYGITMEKFSLSPNIKLLITVGFLGGFTTFSTFSLEVFSFAKSGKYMHGLTYLIISIVMGLLFSTVGYMISQWQIKL